MRRNALIATGIAAILTAASPVQAQKAEGRKSVTGTRYLNLNGVTIEPALNQFEAAVRLNLQTGKVAGASLDACIGADPLLNRVDRLTGTLEPKGEVLRGNGTSSVEGKPWSIELRQTRVGTGLKVEGTVEYAGKSHRFSGEDLALSEESGLLDGGEDGFDPDEGRADPASLNRVRVVVPLGGLPRLVDLIRSEGGSLPPNALVADCDALRKGRQDIDVVVAPDRSEAFVAKANAIPGLKAGMAPEYATGNRVRLTGLPAYGEADERALAEKVVETARGVLAGATVTGSVARDPVTGRWTAVLERPSAQANALGLVERDTLVFSIGRSTEARERTIVAFESLSSRLVADPGRAGKLALEGAGGTEEDYGDGELLTATATETIRDALARAADGELVDEESGKWSRPKGR